MKRVIRKSAASNSEPVPPRWPPAVLEIPDDEAVYEAATITVSSIALVTNRTVKVTISCLCSTPWALNYHTIT